MNDALLTDTDQRILQWQREGRPDAEIAVRIGLTVGETKERIQKLKRRLEEEDADHARWRRPESGDEPVIDFASPSESSEPYGPPPGKTYSRRAVIGAGLAGLGASAAAAAGGFALFGRGDDEPAADAEGTPTSRPGSTPTPGATPTAHPGLAAITRDDSAWSRTRLPNRGEMPYRSGIAFIDSANGDIDVMQLVGIPEPDAWIPRHWWSPSGRFVAAELTSPLANVAGLIDRETGRGWSWDPAVMSLFYLGDALFAFAAVRRDPTYGGNPYSSGPVYFTDAELQPVASVDIGPDIAGVSYIAGHAAESGLFLMMRYSSPRPYIFDLATGGWVEGEPVPAILGPYAIAEESPANVISILTTRSVGETLEYIRVDYDRTGAIVRQVASETRDLRVQQAVSPDGRWLVRQGALRDTSFSLGDNEVWSYVELLDATNDRPAFRVLSGQLVGSPWLADSSAFVIESGRAGVEYGGYNEFRQDRAYYLVDPHKGALAQLDDLPAELDFSAFFPSVMPAPGNPDLIGFGGTIVHNTKTGEWFGPTNAPFTFGGVWIDGSRELQFSFPPGGRDGASSGTILPPYVEEPPFRDDVSLQIARAGTCVNLRAAPSKDAEVLDCLADAVGFTVVSPTRPFAKEEEYGFVNGRPAFWNDDNTDPSEWQMYVHGRTLSGATGWVAVQYLDWAP